MSKKGGVEETPEQKALAQTAMDRVADYKRRWVPVENQFIRDASDRNRLKDKAKGQAAAETRAQFGQQQGKLEAALSNRGAAPGSGQFIGKSAGLMGDEAYSGGLTRSGANLATETEYAKGLQDIVNMGQGQAGQALKGLSSVADLSGKTAAADAAAAAQNEAAIGTVVGTAAGYGMKSWGTTNPSVVQGTVNGPFGQTQAPAWQGNGMVSGGRI